MVKKRNISKKKSNTVKKRVVRITSNPFLNFFLSVCKIKANRVVEKIARSAAVEWRRMNYLDKTPYYLLADEAKKRKKKSLKKKEYEYKYSDWDSPIIEFPKKRSDLMLKKMKSDSEIRDKKFKERTIQSRRKSEVVKRKRSSSSTNSDSMLTSDVEELENILESSERDLKQRKFWPLSPSESSFGTSTSNAESLEVTSSISSITLEDTGLMLKRTRNFP
ncbi:hypothetical protein HHI36_014653 [Cryptolaemus montrouzieri]|uniref:HMG box domain-containing protein n=1 Tax=Cryptolaemus montrouzieri TaxID=559131 RepID=A0ABD2N3D5_9CUCU